VKSSRIMWKSHREWGQRAYNQKTQEKGGAKLKDVRGNWGNINKEFVKKILMRITDKRKKK